MAGISCSRINNIYLDREAIGGKIIHNQYSTGGL